MRGTGKPVHTLSKGHIKYSYIVTDTSLSNVIAYITIDYIAIKLYADKKIYVINKKE